MQVPGRWLYRVKVANNLDWFGVRARPEHATDYFDLT
jgi:hypothetical protein